MQFRPRSLGHPLHAESVLKEHHPEEGGDKESDGPEDFGENTHAGNLLTL